jgi:hypothetical protein
MQMVQTKDGLVPRDELEVTDVTEWHDNARVVATEWRKAGELVRRDVHVSILRGHSLSGEQGAV